MADPIEHVVVLMMENNSFDRMLGSIPGVDGVDAAELRSNPDFPTPDPIFQAVNTNRVMTPDPEHELDDVLRQMAGPCEGFVSDFAQHYPQTLPPQRAEIMGYFGRGFLGVMHTLAESFAVCDRWFSSLPGPTWPNRFFVHSGTSLGHVKMPNGVFHPNLHLYDQPTVYQRLSEQNIDWAIYYGDFPQSIAMTQQWQHLDRYHPMAQFFAAASGSAAAFPQYSFIEPTYFGAAQNDQHPPADVFAGEALIAQIYNALWSNAELWQKMLLVILYDEHGGFYDHVSPGPAIPPDDHTDEFPFNVYGPRVPALLISPWIDRQVISDVFDHTSLLKYVTDKWGLGALGARTAAAQSFGKYLTLRAGVRMDAPRPLAVPAFAAKPATAEANANQDALIAFSRFLETKIAGSSADMATTLQDIGARLIRSMAAEGNHAEVAVERLAEFLKLRTAAASASG